MSLGDARTSRTLRSGVVTFDEWLQLPESERREIAGKWSGYRNEGGDIVKAAAEHLARQFAGEGVGVDHGVYHCGDWIIAVRAPFVFDNRRVPQFYLGICVRRFGMDLPAEFRIGDPRSEYVWAPERYEAFVDRAADEIRSKLGRPDMSRKDMLDALCGDDFDEFTARCRQWEREGKIPTYRRTGR
jgi:hypothetical protein